MSPKNSPLVIRAYILVLLIVVKTLLSHAVEAAAQSQNSQNSQENEEEMHNGDISNSNDRICVNVRERDDSTVSGILCYYQLSSTAKNDDQENRLDTRSITFDRLRRTFSSIDWSTRLKRPPIPFRIGGGLRSNRRIIIEN